MDYSYYFMDEIKDCGDLCYNLFISGYDGCARTTIPYGKIHADEKYWLVFPQYEQGIDDLPDDYLTSEKLSEDEYVLEVFEKIDLEEGKTLCIDATGILIPHLLFIIQFLKRRGFKNFDIIYSEPSNYPKAEDTVFTKNVNRPRPVEGYSTSAKNVNGDDALIIFAGFDDALVTAVARDKSKSLYKYLFTGFPSIQADMYQQNLLQLSKSKESIGETFVTRCMAPAYDPFVAASRLQRIVDDLMQSKYNIEYIHISPLSTKPMAIAAALVYLSNKQHPIDVIYPPADTYLSEHAVGLKRTWRYTIEF